MVVAAATRSPPNPGSRPSPTGLEWAAAPSVPWPTSPRTPTPTPGWPSTTPCPTIQEEESGELVNRPLEWWPIGGTSVASPIVASMFALAGGSHGVEYPAQTLYSHLGSSLLHDVTAGGNGECDDDYLSCSGSIEPLSPLDCGSEALICKAASGYDGPTGVGTPNGSARSSPAKKANSRATLANKKAGAPAARAPAAGTKKAVNPGGARLAAPLRAPPAAWAATSGGVSTGTGSSPGANTSATLAAPHISALDAHRLCTGGTETCPSRDLKPRLLMHAEPRRLRSRSRSPYRSTRPAARIGARCTAHSRLPRSGASTAAGCTARARWRRASTA